MVAHYAVTPTVACNAILAGLSSLLFHNGGVGAGGTGCVRTIKRYAGDKYDLDAIDLYLTAGLPAMLVTYLGGSFEPASTDGQLHNQRMRFGIICCAGRYSSSQDRLSKDATNPGVEELLDWASYYGCRALDGALLKRVKPIDHKWLQIKSEKYIATAEIEATRRFDVYDDAVAHTLVSLGIVHDPLSLSQLFEVDNLIPHTNDPATVRGGVATL